MSKQNTNNQFNSVLDRAQWRSYYAILNKKILQCIYMCGFKNEKQAMCLEDYLRDWLYKSSKATKGQIRIYWYASIFKNEGPKELEKTLFRHLKNRAIDFFRKVEPVNQKTIGRLNQEAYQYEKLKIHLHKSNPFPECCQNEKGFLRNLDSNYRDRRINLVSRLFFDFCNSQKNKIELAILRCYLEYKLNSEYKKKNSRTFITYLREKLDDPESLSDKALRSKASRIVEKFSLFCKGCNLSEEEKEVLDAA